jgi:flavin-dependent dehydrogenase
VHGLVFDPDSGRTPQGTGVRFAGGQAAADLVVDATGRRSTVAKWLAAAGTRSPRTRTHRVGLAYACRWYRANSGAMARTWLPPVPWTFAAPCALSIAFPSDNDPLGVALVCPVDDPTLPALRDPRTFDNLARLFPSSGAWLSHDPQPVGEVHIMAGLDNRWSPTADDAGPVVTGLVRVGDALVHTNPTPTQGIPLALWAAGRVAETAHKVTRHEEFARSYDEWARTVLRPWFDLQVAADRDNGRRLSGTAGAPVDGATRQKAARFPLRSGGSAGHACLGPDTPHGADAGRGVRLRGRPAPRQVLAQGPHRRATPPRGAAARCLGVRGRSS